MNVIYGHFTESYILHKCNSDTDNPKKIADILEFIDKDERNTFVTFDVSDPSFYHMDYFLLI